MIKTDDQFELSPKIQSALKLAGYFSDLELSIREGRIAIAKMRQEFATAEHSKKEVKKMISIYHKLVKISEQLSKMKQNPDEELS